MPIDKLASPRYGANMSSILKRGLTPTHELMGNWIVANPGGTLREMGAYFGYSVSWLSQVINSDMFKAYMADRLGEIHANVMADIPQRMAALTHLAIDRMTETLEKTEDGDLIKDSFDKVLHRYGYAPGAANAVQPRGPRPSGPMLQQNNVFYLTREQFQSAQEKLVRAHDRPALPQPQTEGDGGDSPSSADKVQAGSRGDEREDLREATLDST